MFDSFVIFGGCGFIGTHMQHLLKERYPEAKVYVADLLADGTELSQKVDVRKTIEMQGSFGKNTLVFNFAAVHRTPGHPDHATLLVSMELKTLCLPVVSLRMALQKS